MTPVPRTARNAGLTDRQLEILTWIYESARDKGIQPTYRQMMEVFGIRSPNGIMCHLTALERKDYIKITGAHHGLVILRKPDGTPFTGFAEKLAGTAQECSGVRIPRNIP